MSPIKQMLAGFGIGAAHVNTRIQNSTLVPGETIYGTVEIRGGNVTQQVTELTLLLETEYKREVNDSTVWQTYILAQHRLSNAFTVQAGETNSFPFALMLPLETPLSIGQQVRLRTKLAVPNAVDPSDTDPIVVQPHPMMQQVFNALETLNFRLVKAECSYNRYGHSAVPFVQEFEFRPMGSYQQSIEELEVQFKLQPNGLDILLEIDKRGRGLSGWIAEAYDLDEQRTRLHLPSGSIDQQALVRQLEAVLRGALAPVGFRSYT